MAVYAISQALRSLRQHLTSTLATFFTALVSFSLLFLLGLLLWNLDRIVTSLERELEVAAFLKPGAQVTEILNQVKAWPEVGELAYKPRKKPWPRYNLIILTWPRPANSSRTPFPTPFESS